MRYKTHAAFNTTVAYCGSTCLSHGLMPHSTVPVSGHLPAVLRHVIVFVTTQFPLTLHTWNSETVRFVVLAE